jgi:hypothetical protein
MPTRPMTSRLSIFFKGADTECGVFYPKHHLLAIFPNLVEADRAKGELNHAGFANEDVISASGEEVIHFAEDHLVKDGLWGVLMTEVSRRFGTEASYAHDDLAAAKKGAAFVAVHCPTEKLKMKAWKVLEPRNPLVARYYAFGGIFDGIDHLTGEN